MYDSLPACDETKKNTFETITKSNVRVNHVENA